jgi:hypothetical protein
LFAARRLNAPEGAAKFFNFALVSELLTVGNLDEFEHFIKLVNHLLERLGNLSGMLHGLADGRGFGGTKIGGFDPRLGALRFRAALRPALFLPAVSGLIAGRFGRTDRFRFGSGGCFRHRLVGGGFHCLGFVRGKFSRFLGMRFTESAGGILVVSMFRMLGVFCRLG